MHKIPKGEYECPQCKKLTVIGRAKKADEPLTCCDVEMVLKEKTKFTEPPEPTEETSKTKKAKAKKKKAKAKKKKKKATRKKKKKITIEATLPLTPGKYMCPTCGQARELASSDPRDQWLRCTDCFVKMIPASF